MEFLKEYNEWAVNCISKLSRLSLANNENFIVVIFLKSIKILPVLLI